MGRIPLSYLLSILALFLFSLSFFSVDLFMPHLKRWKSEKMLLESKVYLDDSIDGSSDLLDFGIAKAKIAYLLNPTNEEAFENYNLLLFRSKPSNALKSWFAYLETMDAAADKRVLLLERCLNTLRNDELPIMDRRIAAEIAFSQMRTLAQAEGWMDDPENVVLVCELLAESGRLSEALSMIRTLVQKHPKHPPAIFLLVRLSVHLKDTSELPWIGNSLAILSARKDEVGIEAIRHMSLLHLLLPLDPESLNKCINLLSTNENAKPIDFLRINALRFASTRNETEQNLIIKTCSQLFDLENPKELLIFSNWLAKLKAFPSLIEYLPSSKAKTDENLFKIRMNALANLKDVASIHQEVKGAVIIPTRWRIVVEARALTLTGKFKEASIVLDRLPPILGDDFRKAISVCEYLEASGDVIALIHVLETLIEEPIHQRYALQKLLQYRSASAPLEDLLDWMSKLSQMEENTTSFSETYLYFELLDPDLASPSKKLTDLLREAKAMHARRDSPQTRITLALAHLRNSSPDQALVALGKPENWTKWQGSRPAWAFICSQVLSLNHASEKALVVSRNIDFRKMDRAEKESLAKLFPQQIKIEQ